MLYPNNTTPFNLVLLDRFNAEHSRDIEPMKGGYGDSYYYQMVSNVRKYKGMKAPDTSGTYNDYCPLNTRKKRENNNPFARAVKNRIYSL